VAELPLTIRNDLDGVSEATKATTRFLEANKASPEVVFAANLAIEEIVTNAIKYAYSDTKQHEMTVRLCLTASALEIEITDDGNEFDPFAHPQPDLSLPPSQRPIGGLGIHFVRNMLDACSYVRREGRNIVRLTKKL
jgi:anti-sigma regulatory factor (Ser/Thr protein kinase)